MNGPLFLSDSDSATEKSKTCGHSGMDSQPTNSEHKEDVLSSECLGHKGDADYEDTHYLSGANPSKDYVDNRSLMETEDTISLPISNNTGCKHENNEKCDNADSQPSDILDEEDKLENAKLCQTEDYIHHKGCLPETNLGKDLADEHSTLKVNFELTETAMVSEEQKCLNSRVTYENDCQRDDTSNGNHSRSCILLLNSVSLDCLCILFLLILYRLVG